MKAITFVTRSGCSVCESALNQLIGPAKILRVRIDVVDVDGDAAMTDEFGGRVPVVIAGAKVLVEGRISKSQAWLVVWKARR